MPAVFPGKIRQARIVERTQQKLPLDAIQQSQEGIEVHPGIAVIVTLIRAHIRRIKVEKSLRCIPALDDSQRITIFDLYPL
jgi:hypothetical protein